MNQALIKVQRSETKIERKILLKLKTEIINKTDELKMSEERRSYLLHQVANVHDMDSLVSLIREINRLQLNQRPKFIALKKALDISISFIFTALINIKKRHQKAMCNLRRLFGTF